MNVVMVNSLVLYPTSRQLAERMVKQMSMEEKISPPLMKYKEKVDKVDTQLDQQKAGIRAQKKADVGAIKAAARKDGGHVADIGE